DPVGNHPRAGFLCELVSEFLIEVDHGPVNRRGYQCPGVDARRFWWHDRTLEARVPAATRSHEVPAARIGVVEVRLAQLLVAIGVDLRTRAVRREGSIVAAAYRTDGQLMLEDGTVA